MRTLHYQNDSASVEIQPSAFGFPSIMGKDILCPRSLPKHFPARVLLRPKAAGRADIYVLWADFRVFNSNKGSELGTVTDAFIGWCKYEVVITSNWYQLDVILNPFV